MPRTSRASAGNSHRLSHLSLQPHSSSGSGSNRQEAEQRSSRSSSSSSSSTSSLSSRSCGQGPSSSSSSSYPLYVFLTPSVTLACRASAGRSEMAIEPKDGAGHRLQQQLNCNLVICLLLPDDYYTALTILLACHPSVASNYVSQSASCLPVALSRTGQRIPEELRSRPGPAAFCVSHCDFVLRRNSGWRPLKDPTLPPRLATYLSTLRLTGPSTYLVLFPVFPSLVLLVGSAALTPHPPLHRAPPFVLLLLLLQIYI